jgi:mono/diheme cytochrome c family protein
MSIRVSRLPLTLLLLVASADLSSGAEEVDFLRDVRPILATHCLKCHGPDEDQRQGGLRLDQRESATAPADSGERAIVAGDPSKSELLRRINATADSEQMPPPDVKNPLTDSQKQTLRRWIEQGAEYQAHWAFAKPELPSLPAVRNNEWSRNGIDRFVLSRLEQEGLTPSAEADRYTLIRRLYLDLIGLPPTPDEAEAYVNDQSPDAYERLVDRLLASPQYGERWARRWLDLARYADTNGYEKDRARSIWPYRDWVIRALNADLPFDQFSVEQLAGDMLPGATTEQRVATGFHRNTMLNEEGGIDPLEFRFYSVVDRTNTTATVWLGLTLGCAQCHTHKYDPIPHQDYYRFFGLLNNTEEPELPVPDAKSQLKRADLERQIAERTAKLREKFPLPEGPSGDDRSDEERRSEHLQTKFEAWLADQRSQRVAWVKVRPERVTSNLPRLRVLDDGSILSDGDLSKRDEYTLDFKSPLPRVTAVRLEVLPDESLPKGGPGRVYYEGPLGDFFLSEIELLSAEQKSTVGRASQSFASGNLNAAAAIDGDPLTGWSVNGGQGRAHEAVFQLKAPLDAAGELTLRMVFERYYAAGLGKFRISVTSDEREKIEASTTPNDIQAILAQEPGEWNKQDRNRLLEHYLMIAPELEAERKEIDSLKKQLSDPPTTLVMAERPADFPRPTHRYKRGEFLSPAEVVQPGVLSLVPQLDGREPANRLELAQWFFRPGHPLTGRVSVNRQWAAFFGRGLVRTTEDFGFQGELSTHPQLLDWLALELPRRNWSMKDFHRLIVTSNTYRQSSQASEPLQRKDPENRLLARGPRFRLEAEIIRDSALRSSGLLSSKMLGPSVYPTQPASVTTEGAYRPLDWKVSPGEDRYRRSLYTFSKRSAPFALFNTFDAPSGEACIARREISNTPLQALSLMNDDTFVEAAQALGNQISALPADDSAKATLLFQRVLTRPPTSDEVAMLIDFRTNQLHRLEQGELDAKLIATPEATPSVAAWTLVARVLLNTDESVSKR